MKSSVKRIVLAGLALGLAGVALETMTNINLSGLFMESLKIAAFVLLTLFFSIIIHELGHVVAGLINNYSFMGMQILWLSIYVENGKLKARIDRDSKSVGMAIMIPNEKATEANHVSYFISGILANALSLIPLLFAYIFLPSIRLYLFFSIAIILFLIFLNAMPKEVDGVLNDGYLVKLYRSNENQTFKLFQKLQAQLISGTRPKEVELSSFVDGGDLFSLMIHLYSYYKALDGGDISKMIEEMNYIEGNYQKFGNIHSASIQYELIYYYSRVVKNPFEATRIYSKVESMLEKDFDINGRRVLAYYSHEVLLDEEKAERCIREGLRVADKYPIQGMALMEEDLLINLRNEILRRETWNYV
ncbi:MAG: hypothetical protein Q4G61_02605 [Tissierellia bacterium]|nr:hypothetical protein [Tissierellia bacterium]